MSRSENRALDAFLEHFYNNLERHGNNQKATFHAINDDFEKRNNFKPFNSYATFKNAKSRKNKKR